MHILWLVLFKWDFKLLKCIKKKTLFDINIDIILIKYNILKYFNMSSDILHNDNNKEMYFSITYLYIIQPVCKVLFKILDTLDNRLKFNE